MHYSSIKPRRAQREAAAGVYANLDDLIRVQFKARGFDFLPRQPVHSVLSGRHASRLRGRGLNFEELRNYVPGDDVRTVDWKVTARTREPHVRVYTEERDRPAILVVDQRLGMFFGSRLNTKSVTAAEATALAAWRAVSVGDRVGAVVFDDHELIEIAPLRSHQQVMRILRTVVEKNHALKANSSVSTNPDMLNRALEHTLRLAKHDCLVCSISDGDGADEDTRRLITQITTHNDVLAVFVYDELEKDLPEGGSLVFSDGTRQLEIDSGDARLRRRFAADFDSRLEWMRSISLRTQVPLLPIHTGGPVAEQVRQLLGHHRRASRV